MNNKDKIIKKLRNSSMSYLARYEVSTYQFENTLKRKMSYYENDLKEEEKKNILNLIKEEMLKAKFIDDARYAERLGPTSPAFPNLTYKDGDLFDGDEFPILFSKS